MNSQFEFWIFIALIFGAPLLLGLMLGFWIGDGYGRWRAVNDEIEARRRRAEIARRAVARLRRAEADAAADPDDVLHARVIL